MTRLARTDTYEHAISGLLAKRQEMTDEIANLREQQANLSNDLEALDRTLERLGYNGPITLTPRVPRVVLFYRGESRSFIANRLKEAGPQTTRQLALHLCSLEGKDARDRRLVNDIVKRWGKALRQMQDAGMVTRSAERVRGEYVWQTT